MSQSDEEEYITVTQCKDLRGCSRANIHHAIKVGHIAAKKIGYQYVIKRSDCLNYQPISPKEKAKQAAEARWKDHKKAD
jgi:hypothetical protein